MYFLAWHPKEPDIKLCLLFLYSLGHSFSLKWQGLHNKLNSAGDQWRDNKIYKTGLRMEGIPALAAGLVPAITQNFPIFSWNFLKYISGTCAVVIILVTEELVVNATALKNVALRRNELDIFGGLEELFHFAGCHDSLKTQKGLLACSPWIGRHVWTEVGKFAFTQTEILLMYVVWWTLRLYNRALTHGQ